MILSRARNSDNNNSAARAGRSSSHTSKPFLFGSPGTVLGCCVLLVLVTIVVDVPKTDAYPAQGYSGLSDYDNYPAVRELMYEILAHRVAAEHGNPNSLEEAGVAPGGLLPPDQIHEIVRKANNNRSPSLRLRFGRRADPSMAPGAPHGQ